MPFKEIFSLVHLEHGGLVLAVSTVEARETGAGSVTEVTETTSGAITSSLVSVAIKGVSAGGALLKLTGRSTVTCVTEATHVLHGVPGSVVSAPSLDSQVLLRPAGTTVVTVVRASGTLASNTIVSREALARAGFAVAGTLVGALHPGVEVVGVDDITDPGEVAGAGAEGAIRTSPLVLTVKTSETLAVAVLLTGSVVGAMVLAQTSIAVAALVPGDLTPPLDGEGGSRCGDTSHVGGVTSACGTDVGFGALGSVRRTTGTCHLSTVGKKAVVVDGADLELAGNCVAEEASSGSAITGASYTNKGTVGCERGTNGRHFD